MSVGASGWAFRQKIPPKPKMVLMALADQADERTGKVCYGATDIDHIAEKSSIPRRTLFRYIAALVRNGYIGRERGRGRNHTNSYWLCLDRAPADDLKEWKWGAISDDADPLDIDDGDAKRATMAPFSDDAKRATSGTQNVPSVAHADSLEEPKNIRPALEKPAMGFSRQAQDLERAKAQPQPPDPNERVFVIEGTRWWARMTEWWRKTHGRPINQSYAGEGQFRGKTGRHFRRADLAAALKTGPPDGPLADEDSAEIKANG